MKWLLSYLTIFTILIFSATYASQENDWVSKSLLLIQKEKSVLDAKWRMKDPNVLWVSMEADGTRRDGFAEYLCLLLGEAGRPEGTLTTVYIFAPSSYESGLNEMGIAVCP